MSEISLLNWNIFIDRFPNAHFMQSGQWGELKSSFGWEPARFIDGHVGAQLLFRKLPLGLTIAYMPKGPIGTASPKLWKHIDQACKKRNAIFLKIEPDQFEEDLNLWKEDFPGFKKGMHNIQPPNTILIDLVKDEESLLRDMRQKTRYNIRLAARKGVIVEEWSDISAFHRMSLVTGGRDGFGVHSLKYYQRVYELFKPTNMCELLVAKYENQPLASLLIFYRGERAWYVYGASSNIERNKMPTYLLQWEAIRRAKARGCTQYDLWGIPDQPLKTLEEDFIKQTKGLWGVYRFKRGFGGNIRRNVQCLDKAYKPILTSLYDLYTGNRVMSR